MHRHYDAVRNCNSRVLKMLFGISERLLEPVQVFQKNGWLRQVDIIDFTFTDYIENPCEY